MRIALAGQAYFREDNGQAVFTVRLARGLANAGHKVMVIAPSAGETSGIALDGEVLVCRIPAIHLPHNANITLPFSGAIRHAITSFQPDIIHLQDHYFLSSTAKKVAKKFNIPTVGTNHFLPRNIIDNLPLPSFLEKPATRLLWLHMLRKYNTLRSVTTPTQTAVSILQQQGLKPPSQAISCGIDIARFKLPSPEEKKQARARWDIAEEIVTFVYVGRIDHEKGLNTVLDALAQLNDKRVRFIAAGKGSHLEELKKQSTRLKLDDQVIFLGFLSNEDLSRLLHCGDCFIMAGHAELQSIATLEAMASGLPIIAANACALPELVSDDANGFLFTPGDSASLAQKMEQFIEGQNLWADWSQKSRSIACRHAIDSTVEKYLSWYQTAIKTPPN